MKTAKIETLTKQRDQLNARIQALRARESAQRRKEDTRRKVLIGGAILKLVKDGKWEEEKFLQMMDAYLKKPSDRILFGLKSVT